MTRSYSILMTVVAICLLLCACAPTQELPEPSEPTLPSFSLEQTPFQQLSAALLQTKAEESFDIRYGTRTQAGEEITEHANSLTVSEDQPLNWETLYAALPELPDREDFLERFGAEPLRVIPSNSGVIRFETDQMSAQEAWELLYSDGDSQGDGVWSVALAIDAAGRLREFEITAQREDEIRTVFLSLSFPEHS